MIELIFKRGLWFWILAVVFAIVMGYENYRYCWPKGGQYDVYLNACTKTHVSTEILE